MCVCVHMYVHMYVHTYILPAFIVPQCHIHEIFSAISRPKADSYAALLSVCEAASSWVRALEAEVCCIPFHEENHRKTLGKLSENDEFIDFEWELPVYISTIFNGLAIEHDRN